MQDPVTETQEPTEVDATPQNLEGDPGKVQEDVFKGAAEILEYQQEETPEETPEVEAKIEEPTESGHKPAIKRTKKPKDEPKPEPEAQKAAETQPEPQEEPKLSRREAFKAKADEESAYRAKEAKLKEREAKAQALEDRYRDFEADPIKHLEAKDPKFYEKLTQRYLDEGKTPEKAETSALRAEIAALREEITGKHEDTNKQIQMAEYERQLNEGVNILSGTEFDPVRESAAFYEKFTGQPTDMRKALANIWIEYNQMYQKELTPAECCEILLEDAQAHIERVSTEFGSKPAEKKQTPKKKTPPPPGKTLTQTQETQSAPAPTPGPQTFASKEEMFASVAEGLEYESPEE